jgi:multisubunit Na+/H+ antiporter MnhB subunit
MSGLVFDALLCTLIGGTAVAAVAGRDAFRSIVFYIVYGLLAAIAWVRLGAVDVALAEAAIGAGLTGVLLVAASARVARLLQRPADARRAADSSAVAAGVEAGAGDGGTGVGVGVGVATQAGASDRSRRAVAAPMRQPDEPARPGRTAPSAGSGSRAARALTALACAGVAGLVALAVLALDPAGAGLSEAVNTRLDIAGAANPVTAVLLNFRAFDTLLETMVLLVALVGVWSLADDRHWGGLPGLRQHARHDGVLASFGRFLPPVGLLVGVYLVWVGASQPGGAFQGGTVLAAVALLVVMAALRPPPPVSSLRLRLALVAGPVVFLAIGALGLLGGHFLGLPVAFASMLIAVIEAALALSIAVTLALLVAGPPQQERQP